MQMVIEIELEKFDNGKDREALASRLRWLAEQVELGKYQGEIAIPSPHERVGKYYMEKD